MFDFKDYRPFHAVVAQPADNNPRFFEFGLKGFELVHICARGRWGRHANALKFDSFEDAQAYVDKRPARWERDGVQPRVAYVTSRDRRSYSVMFATVENPNPLPPR